MTGTVLGGWAFVWAAYIVSALALGGYAARVLILYALGRRLSQHERP